MIFKRNIFAYLSASLVERGLGLLGSTLAMRRNPAEAFGLFSHLRALPLSILPFASLGLENAVARVHARAEKAPYLFAIFIVWVATALAAAAFAAPIAAAWFGPAYLARSGVPLIDLRVLLFSGLILSQAINACIATEQGRLAAGLTSLMALVAFAAMGAFAATHSIPLAARTLACGSAALLAGLLALRLRAALAAGRAFLARLASGPGEYLAVLFSDFRFSLPFALAACIAIVANRAASVVFANVQDGEGLALVNLALSIASLIQIFGWAVNNSENPKVLNGLLAAGNPPRGLLEDAFRRLSDASHLAVIGCCLSTFAAALYALYSTAKWGTGAPVLALILIFSVLKLLLEVVGNFMQYDFLYLRGRLGRATLLRTALLLVQIPLLGFLVARFGVPGALGGYLLISLLGFLPGELFLGAEFRRERMAVYGRHLLAVSPFLLLLLADSPVSLACLTALAGAGATAADWLLAPADFRSRVADALRRGRRPL